MSPVQELAAAFASPMYALPVDAFRVLAGLVGLAYFASAYLHVADFSSPEGLIDHALTMRLFPPTRLSLFQPGLPKGAFKAVFLLACAASVCVILGYQTKSAAALLYLTAVSTYRWNILAVYVDDAIVHLVFFWLLLLPVGSTLNLGDWMAGGAASFDAWSGATVPGTAVRCFLLNLALVYVVAGAYKFTSAMWRNGTALHAILKMPIARTPDFWQPRHHSALRWANYGALILEPAFALMFVLPANSTGKWLLVSAAAAFHLGIIATLKIPFANLAMLGAFPIVLASETMQLGWGLPAPTAPDSSGGAFPADAVAVALVAALTAMVVWEVCRSGWRLRLPLWKTHMSGFLGNPIYVGLWLVGIAQSYRLLDWIDTRNYHVRYEVSRRGPRGLAPPAPVDATELFPRTLRHLLLQSYIVGNIWLQIDGDHLAALRRSLLVRHARRYARLHPDAGTIEVYAILQRITSDNLTLCRGERRLLMRFTCRGGRAQLIHPSREALEAACAAS